MASMVVRRLMTPLMPAQGRRRQTIAITSFFHNPIGITEKSLSPCHHNLLVTRTIHTLLSPAMRFVPRCYFLRLIVPGLFYPLSWPLSFSFCSPGSKDLSRNQHTACPFLRWRTSSGSSLSRRKERRSLFWTPWRPLNYLLKILKLGMSLQAYACFLSLVVNLSATLLCRGLVELAEENGLPGA